jgi:hypothetical protein
MVWYKVSAHAPSSQPMDGGNGSLLYIRGGVAAGICVTILVRASRQTTPPPPGADEATISSLKTIAYAAPLEEEGRIECENCLEEYAEGEALKQLPCCYKSDRQ